MHKQVTRDQRGIVSIMVAMIMMIVISLIVVGFSSAARRNQREIQDNQQSTQAYYAAETGVNDAVSYLRQHPDEVLPTQASTTCSYFMDHMLDSKTEISNDDEVSYNCLNVNSTPAQLTKSPVTQSSSVVWPITEATNTVIQTLTFTWTKSQNPSAANTCGNSAAQQLPKYTVWNCNYGLLRVDLTDVSDANPTALTLASNTVSLYLKPVAGAGTTNYVIPNMTSLSSKAIVVNTACGNAPTCQATIVIGAVGSSRYYTQMTMMYKDAGSVTVTGTTGVPKSVLFAGAQAVIDSTGKSHDQQRRVQVRAPLTGDSELPTAALSTTDDLCKQLSVSSMSYSSNCP